MIKLLATGIALPKNSFSQEETLKLLGYKDKLRQSFFHSSQIQSRRLYIPKNFTFSESAQEANQRAVEGVTTLALQAARHCLRKARISPKEISCVITTTCTATLMPNLDIRVIHDLGLPQNVERMHLGDMGSASGVLALKAASTFLKANKESRALVIASEICSACYAGDGSLDSAVGEAIFSDGASCVVLSNKKKDFQKSGFEILASHSFIQSQYAELMRFEYLKGRRRFVLSKEIRERAAWLLCHFIDQFLDKEALDKEDIAYWILHPAGRKIIDNVREFSGLAESAFSWTRGVFENYGNMSSATSLFVLDRVLSSGQPKRNEFALLAAVGPGLAAEGLLLRWRIGVRSQLQQP